MRLPVDVELQVARVCVWSKADGQKLGLGDAIPAFVINENLDGKLRRETEGRRRLASGNLRRRGPCLDRPRWRVGAAQTGKFGGPGLFRRRPTGELRIDGSVPEPVSEADERALAYMGLSAGTPVREIAVDTVFIGSCTNGRIEDLRAAAHVLDGHRVHTSVRVLVVPGSAQVKAQAEAEGLDRIFRNSGAEWRNSGCSMCLAMNPDVLLPGERCASTSNRNFEGRQGRGGRTHLVSPAMAAAAALHGHFVDVRRVASVEASA